ncbi:MAG TPA: hypothetical protein ENO22_02500 [candidate division Zixibacteria bacterium]|nr:hypothetical protein [candidate division Zixibacteria bacterium]HEQ98193.1 hypothetical protein [candidate division Zixibacteria bacterium]
MKPLNSKLLIASVFTFIALMVIPSTVMAQEYGKREAEEIWLTENDVDTAYEIVKLLSVKNTGTPKECRRENLEDLSKIASKMDAHAVVYITHNTPAGEKDALITNGVAVKYLSPKEIEKRNKKAKKPPKLEKESPLDPEPLLIEYKDVDFPYKILGILEIHTGPAETNFSSQAMDFRLIDDASRYGADGLIWVDYQRVGSDVTAALGIMIKAYNDWETVEKIKAKEVEMMQARQKAAEERAKEQEKAEEPEVPDEPSETAE